MESLNEKFRPEDGYPLVRLYRQKHWYHYYYEIEFSGKAESDDFELFFQNLITFTKEVFKPGGPYPDKARFVLRLNIQFYSFSFVEQLKNYVECLEKLEKQFSRKVKICFFDTVPKDLTAFLEKKETDWQVFDSADFSIEKIEWYWEGMSEFYSPKMCFDPHTGELFIMGTAVASAYHSYHRNAILKWFQLHFEKQQIPVKIYINLDYHDGIKGEIKMLSKLCAEHFSPDRLRFIWYNCEEWSDFYFENEADNFNKLFAPFELKGVEITGEERELWVKKYQKYYAI